MLEGALVGLRRGKVSQLNPRGFSLHIALHICSEKYRIQMVQVSMRVHQALHEVIVSTVDYCNRCSTRALGATSARAHALERAKKRRQVAHGHAH